MNLFTIGHSNHSIEAFIALLHQHGVTALADVRSHPYSRYLPHFNQAPLKTTLREASIHYVFLGQELGARSNDPDCYVDGKALYEKIAATELFQQGIDRLVKGAETHTIALVCAEKDPITCHRAILVCQHLRAAGLNIQHILSNGDLQSQTQLEDRLLDLHGLAPAAPVVHEQLSLFGTITQPETLLARETALREAYKRQGDRIAYVEKADRQHEPVG